MKFTLPNILIRAEGLAVFAVSLLLYFHFGGTWSLFPLILAPDLGLLGFVMGNKVGSVVYNLFHFYGIPLACITYHLLTGEGAALFVISFLWTAHIGMDRLVGFGLRYPAAFKDTHLQHI